ncbi:MAG: hypothetical protein K0U76_08400 [Actinomycetia bacterium]|nr:hypothetical protein [Actinomycetes bacterium]MCH9701397.1 hypothetical protein [Actinomycetes bacterium]MCH9760881.1 hypothetical protein [Actinomycetes bacterium]
MAYLPPRAPDDWCHSDLAALDFSVCAEGASETEIGVILGDYPPETDSEDNPATPMFTVSNPHGTVTVTTLMDGQVHQIDLSPKVAALTEAVLAEEIVVIAGLATQDARSAQYVCLLEGMREHGHDTVGTRDFLTRDLQLPTPEQARADRAETFATRYAGEE